MKVNILGDVYRITLPQHLYAVLKAKVEMSEGISLDLAVYLLNLILTNAYKDKRKDYQGEYVRLCSRYLIKLNTNDLKYKRHLDWMQEHGLIDIANHSNFGDKAKKCKGYRVIKQYLKPADGMAGETKKSTSEIGNYAMHSCKDDKLIKKFNSLSIKRKVEARCSTSHLTRWLDDSRFTIDTDQAIEYVEQKYSSSADIHKRNKRLMDIADFESKRFTYSRDGKDDRLHHYFVSIASDIKQFIRYEGKPMKEIDIKSCQPFILTVILGLIIRLYMNNDKRGIKKLLSKALLRLVNNTGKGYYLDKEYYKIDLDKILCNTIMCLKALEPTDFNHIFNFIFLVRTGDVYDHVGEELLSAKVIWEQGGKYYVKLAEEFGDKTIQKEKEFDTLRNCAKVITLNAIYTNPKGKGIKAVNEFRNLFPAVTRILDAMKESNYKDVPILIQRIESKCVLDHCAKKISKKYPEIPLIARHDSLSTTEDYFDILKGEFRVLLDNYFGVEVEVGEEDW